MAAEVRGEYANGVTLVDLAPVRDQRLVPMTVARVLGVRESGGRSALDLLLLHLRTRHMLLVLDNFEHLASAAPLLTELLSDCPQLTLLVTSRTALRLRPEHRLPVGPLPTPADDAPLLEDLAEYPSGQLFVDRLAAVSPGFVHDAANAPKVADICRRLEGIPLALDLAAGRAQLLSPAALLQRLDHRPPLSL